MSEIILKQGDCLELMKDIPNESVHALISDIPYGINYEEWDILHNNKNNALGGTSPAQNKSQLFKRRGKPINGWSAEDKKIPIEYQNWCTNWGKIAYKILKPGGSIILFAGKRYIHRCIIALEDIGFNYRDIIIWYKQQAPFKAQRVSCVFERRHDIENAYKYKNLRLGNLAPVCEPIIWLQKPYKQGTTLTDNLLKHEVGCFNSTILKQNFISLSNKISKNIKYHPTQKPTELMKILIETFTLENQIVLDPFMGSGSTGVACINTNRNFIGIELDEKYFNIAEERINNAQTEKR